MSAKSLSENGCVQFIFTESLSAIIEKLFIIAAWLLGVVRLPREEGEGSGPCYQAAQSQGWSKTTNLLSSPLFRLDWSPVTNCYSPDLQ